MRELALAFLGVLVTAATVVAGQATASVTYSDVAPIFREKCVRCHAPNEMAPMSLTSYKEARPWARSIKQKVSSREMPPWYIDRSIGIQQYQNDPSLTNEQIRTLVRWVDAGAPEGSAAATLPVATAKVEGWAIGTPDLIVKKKPFRLYAEGSDWWQQELVETGLTEDRWVKAAELKPGHRKIVHHFCVGPVGPSSAAGSANVNPVGPQERYAREESEAAIEEAKLSGEGVVGARTGTSSAASIGAGGFGCYLPGNGAKFFGDDTGLLLKAGSRLSFGMHYSAAGEDAVDESSIGLIFHPKGVVPKYSANQGFFQKFPAFELDIPPNTKTTHDAYMHLPRPTLLTGFTPHMHMRGSALVLEAIVPSGRVMTISAVKDYNFNWQLDYTYDLDVAPLLPAGTMLHAIVTHDNTAQNRHNPDPNRWVGYGQASTEEMAGTFVQWVELSPEEYRQRAAERRARERAALAQQER